MTDTTADNRVIAVGDRAVPAELRVFWPDEVAALYVRGPFPPARPAIAIVGTTDPHPAARAWAFASGQEAVRQGWAVVSGLARGIDGAAHEGALAAGGVTIGVVANGLDNFFPAGRESLVERIIANGGSILSISPPGTPATREGLLLRNQFTSALADVVLAVQAKGRGGTIATMRHACRQGRLIATFRPPPRGYQADWEGNHLLLGDESPWRDRDLAWEPAFSMNEPTDIAKLFAHFQVRPPVDAPARFRETRKPEQPRLLEERATYDGDE